MPPFEYRPYRNPYVNSISDLIERQGSIPAAAIQQGANAQANAALQSGNAWAGAAQQTGQAVSGAIQQATDPRRKLEAIQLQQANQGVSDLKALDNAFTQPGGRDAIIGALPGHLRPTVMKQFNEADAAAANLQESTLKAESATTSYVQTLAEIAKAHDYDPTAMQLGLAHARLTFKNNPSLLDQVGQFENALHQNPTADTVKSIVDPILAGKEAQEKAVVLPATPRGGSPAQLVKPSGAVVATGSPTAPPEPTAARIALDAVGGDPVKANEILHPTKDTHSPIYKEWQDYQATGGKLGFDDYMTADANRKRPVVNVSGQAAMYNATDPKSIAQGIRDGSMPPDISQYGRAVQGAVATELQKNGFNLSQAQTDWKATQKHVASLNSTQQTKLNQSINALPDMLDKVDALASQWKGGQFPILNKANLSAAKNGAYGSEVASVARQLETQIADVTSDLGNIYMGGNSPTDHALKLAGTALASDWDEKVLHDMVRLAKGNVTIRSNSMKNTGVAGASQGNPYATPSQKGPAPEQWVPDGKGGYKKQGGD